MRNSQQKVAAKALGGRKFNLREGLQAPSQSGSVRKRS